MKLMKKIDLNVIPSVDTSDIIQFIVFNSDLDWNKACSVFSFELDYIQYNLPKQIEMMDEYRISKVIVNKLEYSGWIKEFTKAHELDKDYYILFTD